MSFGVHGWLLMRFLFDLSSFLILKVCSESQRFEKLMEDFKNEDNNIDFMVS